MGFYEKIEVQDLAALLNGVSVDKRLLNDINRGLDKAGIYYRSFSRMKSPDSLAAKLQRKASKYKKENTRLQDIVGIRIILYFEDDVAICKNIIENMFDVREEDCQIDALEVSEFKPERMNLVCTLSDEYVCYFQKRLWDDYRIDKTFELQIRTIFSEGWHEVEHDIRYKHNEEWKAQAYYSFNRELNGIKATLEVCDHAIVHTIEKLTYYCYKNGKTEEMLRYKFRIHFDNEYLSDSLKAILDQDLRRELHKIVREEVLMCFCCKFASDIPKTLDNLVFVCNELQIHNEKISEITPRIIKEQVEIYQKELPCNTPGTTLNSTLPSAPTVP